MRHAMNAFQMGGILILHLVNNTIVHSLKNIHFISPKGNKFCSNICIKKTTMFFQNTHNNFSWIIYAPPSITCFKEMSIAMWH